MGGPAAFAFATLIEGHARWTVPVASVPEGWNEALDRVCAPPSWAGLPPGPWVMGILNATPDSFSDGGRHFAARDAIESGLAMAREGAAVLDIGGESTRPGAPAVDVAEEWARVGPIISALKGRSASLLSVDTRNAATMAAALWAGADIINDVSALAHDPEAASVLARSECSVVLMHMRGTPETMGEFAHYDDVAVEVVRELEARIVLAERVGIARARIIVDPGIGFAKTPAQSCELLARLPILANLGCRVLLGTSRKRFIGAVADVGSPTARGPGTIASSLPGLDLPGTILRVHEVAPMLQALRVWQAMQGWARGI
jgi:dihydropteroate synthase